MGLRRADLPAILAGLAVAALLGLGLYACEQTQQSPEPPALLTPTPVANFPNPISTPQPLPTPYPPAPTYTPYPTAPFPTPYPNQPTPTAYPTQPTLTPYPTVAPQPPQNEPTPNPNPQIPTT